MLSPDEADQLAQDVWDLVWDRAADIASSARVPVADPAKALLLAAHEVDAALPEVCRRVTRRLDEMAQQAELPHAAVGLARGQTRQAVGQRWGKAGCV